MRVNLLLQEHHNSRSPTHVETCIGELDAILMGMLAIMNFMKLCDLQGNLARSKGRGTGPIGGAVRGESTCKPSKTLPSGGEHGRTPLAWTGEEKGLGFILEPIQDGMPLFVSFPSLQRNEIQNADRPASAIKCSGVT